jgi:hypothetical protein
MQVKVTLVDFIRLLYREELRETRLSNLIRISDDEKAYWVSEKLTGFKARFPYYVCIKLTYNGGRGRVLPSVRLISETADRISMEFVTGRLGALGLVRIS